MTREERLIAILKLLQRSPGRVTSTDTIRAKVAYERTANGDKMLGRDLEALRRRGLIRSGFNQGVIDHNKGVEALMLPKPPALHLSSDEHEAIARARARLRPGVPAVGPLDVGDHDDAELVGRIVRHLEELDDEVELGALAADTGATTKHLLDLLTRLQHESRGADGTIRFIDIGFADNADEVPVSLVRGRAERPHGVSPTEGIGMWELGFFAYSLGETEERLSLIEEALDDPATSAQQVAPLRAARRKLLEWQGHLQRQTEMS